MGSGDELMLTGHVRELQQKDPRKVRLAYERPTHWNAVFDHNPRIATIGEQGDFQVLVPRTNGLRPYCERKMPDRWFWKPYTPLVGELYFQPEELDFAAKFTPDVVIEPNLKGGASPNKDWGAKNWFALIQMMRAEGILPVQLGPAGTRKFHGAQFVETPTFRMACAVLARARAGVLHEGGLHHAAAVVNVRSVVIYGGYIGPEHTGYQLHRNLTAGGKPCGMRLPCNHCARAMQKITPEQVLAELKAIRA